MLSHDLLIDYSHMQANDILKVRLCVCVCACVCVYVYSAYTTLGTLPIHHLRVPPSYTACAPCLMCVSVCVQRVLPDGVEAPSSFETVGHIIHLNLRKEQLPYKYIIGQVGDVT